MDTFQEPRHPDISVIFELDRPNSRSNSLPHKPRSSDFPPRKQKKTAGFRTSSLDRGRDTYYSSWNAETFQPSAAISLETDPQTVELLWHSVTMAAVTDNKKRVKGLPGGPKLDSTGGFKAKGPRSISDRTTTTESSAAQTADTTVTEKKLKRAPYDNNFEDRVLTPRGITFRIELSMKAYKHFGVEEPVGSRSQYYAKKTGAIGSSLWLEHDDLFIESITAEYNCMVQSNFCEAEFAGFATGDILKHEPRNLDLKLKRCWRTERTIQLVAKPRLSKGSVWLPPPVISDDFIEDYTHYEFDLRPDCTYWLSLQAFSHEYMIHVEEIVSVMKRRILSPYLTIEFKKDNSDEQSALNQVAAAASLALYNRFLLRKKAMVTLKRSWNKRHIDVIKHYGITFMGSEFNVWCMKAVLTEDYEWAGCEMTRVHHGNCTHHSSVRELFDWLNEIHCWGLTIHGPKCEKDIKNCIGVQTSGIRVSDISPDSEDELEEEEIMSTN